MTSRFSSPDQSNPPVVDAAGSPRRFFIAVSPAPPASPRRADEGVLATLRGGKVRENLCLLSLGAILSSQCLLPTLAVAGEVKAVRQRTQAQRSQGTQREKVDARQAAQEAEKRSKAQPVPAWYKRLRDGEKARLKKMRAAKVPPVVRATAPVRPVRPASAAVPGEAVPKGGSFRDGTITVDAFRSLPAGPRRATVTTQGLAQMVRRSRLPWNRPRAAKPGVIEASAPLYVPNPLTSTKRIDVSGDRVPDQIEISRAGQMCGAMAPAAPADTKALEKQLDEEMVKLGVPDGLKANLPPDTAPGLALKEKKERLAKAKAMNREFALAMNLWNDRQWKKSVEDLHAYAKKYPKSPWTPEALIHVADDAKFQGKANDAADLYAEVMAMTSPKPGPMSYEPHQKAYERLADLYLIQGRYSEARPILLDIARNDIHWRRRTWGSHWLGQLETMRSNRATAMGTPDCGNKALAMVLGSLGHKAQAREVAALKPPREAGFNMAEMQAVGQQNGLELRGFRAKAEQLAQLPLPAVLHYGYAPGAGKKVVEITTVSGPQGAVKDKGRAGSQKPSGHFVVAWKVDRARKLVHLQNPQDGIRYVLSYGDLDREWTGRGLLLASQLDKGRRPERVAWLSHTEMQGTTGACFVVSAQVSLGAGVNTCGINGSCGSGGGGGGGGGGGRDGDLPTLGPTTKNTEGQASPSYGSPSIAINKISQNIYINDTPLWYHPPVGPPVEITVSYNSQDASNYNTLFGNKWSFNYGSHVVETSDQRVSVFMPDGRQDTYLPNGSGGFTNEKGNYNTLVKTGVLSYELRFQGGDKVIYGIPAGTGGQQPFMLSWVDRFGQALSFGYNASVQMTTITDAQGKITRLQWTSGPYGSRVTRVVDPFERHADFRYDDNGNMIECVDMEGNAFQYTYDASVNVVMLNTAQGPWSFEFQDYGPSGSPTFGKRSTAIWNPLQEQPERYLYDGGDHVGQYSHIDRRQGVTRYTVTQVRPATYYETNENNYYLPQGADSRVSSLTTPTGESASYSYDPNSLHVSSTMGSNGLYTNISYNAKGRPTQIRKGKSFYSGGGDPNERVTTFNYAPNGLDVTSAINALNQTVFSVTYNSQHQPLSATVQGNHTTNYTYTTWGAPETTTEIGSPNVTTSYLYNTDKRIQRVQRAGTVLESYTYDVAGRVKTVTDASNFTLGYSYNNLDALTKVTYPDGTYSQVEYVCCGLPGAVRDRSGRWMYYDYDPLKRLVRTQDAGARSVFYGYDADSNIVSLRDTKGQHTSLRYDSSGRVTRKVYADGNFDAFTYELGTGRLKEKQDGRGRKTLYSYDDYGRPTLVDYANDPSVSLSYDALDRLVQMQDGLGTSTFGYNSVGQLASEDGPFADDAVSYQFDALSRRNRLSIASAVGPFNVSYDYDTLSRLQNITSPAGNFGYAFAGSTGMVQSQSLPNGTSTSYSYDGLQRLTQVQSQDADAGNISRYAYTYDNVTNRMGRTAETSQVLAEAQVTRAYGYDDVDQLTSEIVSQAGATLSTTNLTYDPMGNRQQAIGTSAIGTNTTSYSNNKLNQTVGLSTTSPTGDNISTLTYDQSGNLTGIGNAQSGTNYTYDDDNRLVRVAVPGQSKREFLYDGFARLRISRDFVWQNNAWAQNGEVRRVYDGMNIVQERDAQNQVLATYTRSGNIGGILSRTDQNGSLFYHYDGRGNVSQLSDAQGKVQARYSYDAFGNTTSSGPLASLNRFRFSTKEQLGSLYSYGYRFYSPILTKWLNRDYSEAGGLNLYGFVQNNPTTLVDPQGFQPQGYSPAPLPGDRDNDGDVDASDTYGAAPPDMGQGGSSGGAAGPAAVSQLLGDLSSFGRWCRSLFPLALPSGPPPPLALPAPAPAPVSSGTGRTFLAVPGYNGAPSEVFVIPPGGSLTNTWSGGGLNLRYPNGNLIRIMPPSGPNYAYNYPNGYVCFEAGQAIGGSQPIDITGGSTPRSSGPAHNPRPIGGLPPNKGF